MFDKTTYNSETAVCPVTRVVEKSITPDKVTDMYDDVREEVESMVIKKIRASNNVFNGSVVHMYDDATGVDTLLFQFKLNGKDYEFKDIIPREEFATHPTTHEMLDRLIEFASTEIAKMLVLDNFAELPIAKKVVRF